MYLMISKFTKFKWSSEIIQMANRLKVAHGLIFSKCKQHLVDL